MIVHSGVVTHTRRGLNLHSHIRHFRRCFHETPTDSFHHTRQKWGPPIPQDALRWTYDNLPTGQLPPGIPAPGSHAPEHYFPLYSRSSMAHKRWEKRHNRPNLVPGLLPYDPTDKWADQNHNTTLLLAAQTLRTALRSGEPHAVLRSLIRLSFQADRAMLTNILASMPANTFSEVLRCLDPKHFLHHYQRLHENISPTKSQLLSLPKVDAISYHKFSALFLSLIKEVVAARRQSHPFTATDLRYTLRCARGVGDLRYAEDVWWALTTSGKGYLVPDIVCYNDLLGVICWSDTLHPIKRRRLRNIPWNFAPRSWVTPPVELEGHRVGEKGIGNRVEVLFNEMVSSGQRGNEETFCHMIIGFGRERDFAAVESILKRVWNIDVQELLKHNPNSELSARSYPPDSPFYPSQQIIYSIAHCYGSNNQVPTALAILDFISSQYSVQPNKDAWHELLRWAYTLSRPTSRPPRQAYKRNWVAMNSSISSDSVMNLWKTMVSEPYNIKPNIAMYDLVVRSALSIRKLRYAEELMEEGRVHHIKDVFKLGYLLERIEKTTRQGSAYHEKLARRVHFQQLQVRMNRLTIRRWVEILLFTPHSGSLSKKLSWFARAVPRLVETWMSFVPYRIEYPTATGHVRFWSGSYDSNRERVWRLRYGTEQGRVRKEERRTRDPSGINIVGLVPNLVARSKRSSRRTKKSTSLERRRKQARKERIVVRVKIPELSLLRRNMPSSKSGSEGLWKAALSIMKPSCVSKARRRELRMWQRYHRLRPRLLKQRAEKRLVRRVADRPGVDMVARQKWKRWAREQHRTPGVFRAVWN